MNNSENTKTSKERTLLILLIVAGALVAASVIGAIIFTRTNNAASAPLTSISTQQARALPTDETCLANNSSIKTQVEKMDGLSEDFGPWTSHIYDVPAGTNVDVAINSYNGSDSITGSLAYSGDYGSYNFTLTKQADGWGYTRFTGCN